MMIHSPTPFNPNTFLATLPLKPGVYCMLDPAGKVLYVGKARQLKNRVASYFQTPANLSVKTQALVTHIANIEVTVTHTEGEALLLENHLIKVHQPRYNILLRDDKSYPYLYVSNHPFPRLTVQRGARRGQGQYLGPYADAKSLYHSLQLLQKLFLLRNCGDRFFRHRSRPCLQYQIQRCSAPCVGLIDEASYQEEVQHAVWFLAGKSPAIMDRLVAKMQSAASALDYEKAAKYRDQIKDLKKVQEHQYVSTEKGNVDVVVALLESGRTDNRGGCVQVLKVREGQQLGSRAFFPQLGQEVNEATLLAAFLPQYYLGLEPQEIPDEIILNQDVEEMVLLAEVIRTQSQRSVVIHSKVRGTRARWLEMALENAKASLAQRQPQQYYERLTALATLLNLTELPHRIEGFDVSHTQGEATVASCVVFDETGHCRRAYRRFNIDNITPGDDYAALHQALHRHYSKMEQSQCPDILLIDGGKGQVKVAQTVLAELQWLPKIRILGVAKGPGRKVGLETLILSLDAKPLQLPKDSPALLLIQQIRDEAHRFAITAHRKQRTLKRRISVLEQIEGIGAKRRQLLLSHFGGLEGVARAGVEDLASVPGIERKLAQRIYEYFQGNRN